MATTARESQEKTVLLPGAQIEREITGAEIHRYILALAAGEFVQLVVEGRRSDLVLSLQDSQGKMLTRVDSAVVLPTHRRLSFVSAEAGDYHLTVFPSRKDAAPGSYRISVDAWRRAEAKDESAVAAERVFMEAEALNRQGAADTTRRAIEKYDATLPLWRAAGERLPEAYTSLRIGIALHNLSRFKEALDRYVQALPIFEEIGDERGAAQALTNLGWSHSGLGQFQKAIDYYNRSLEIRRRLNDPRNIAQTLNLLGVAHQALGDPQKAIELYQEALPLAQAAKDLSIEAFTLNGLGWLYNKRGEYRKALESVEQALPLWRKAGNRYGEAQSLNIRGVIYPGGGLAPDQALESFEQANQIWKQLGNRYGEAEILNNTGVVYHSLGDYERARETYLRALEIWQAIGNRNEEAKTLGNLGLIEGRLGRWQTSLEYLHQALALYNTAGNRIGQAITLHNIGSTVARMGKSEQATDYYERALKLAQETGQREVEANILADLGGNYEKLGDEKRAFDYYRRTMSMPMQTGADNLARLELRRGNLSEALALTERISHVNEERRSRLPDQQLRISYGARLRDIHELRADIFMRLHERASASTQPAEQYLTAALETSERTHARSLLETLVEARADIRQGADPALLADERAAQDRLNASEKRRVELLNSPGQEKRLAAVEKEIQELARGLQEVRALIRTRSPRYAALTQPAPLAAGEIRKLLDDDTILLEYLLGKERSFLWMVTPSSIKGYALPGQAEIETQVRHMYELLTKTDQPSPGKPSPPARSNATSEYNRVAATLSRMLLGPVADQLGRKRLLIVGDGALQYLPFNALLAINGQWPVVNGRNGEKSNRPPTTGHRPLIVDHEIINLPSASVLAVLRSDPTNRKPAPKALAVLADPVFNNDDPRVAANRTTPVASSANSGSHPRFESDIKSSLRDAGLTEFVRLRFSRQEADVITSFLPEKDRLKALDFAASRATALGQELAQYRMLHFATHGLVNSRHPELSGLVFSMITEQGQPQDGFLRFHEIYNMKLNAELVVLSACQTAIGKEVRGEGLIGLTRGFMYAGVPRVVASLWRVDDRATAELMKRFYKAMLLDKLRPAAALRAAQISMLKEKLWSAPHYWAAFTLQGEWR